MFKILNCTNSNSAQLGKTSTKNNLMENPITINTYNHDCFVSTNKTGKNVAFNGYFDKYVEIDGINYVDKTGIETTCRDNLDYFTTNVFCKNLQILEGSREFERIKALGNVELGGFTNANIIEANGVVSLYENSKAKNILKASKVTLLGADATNINCNSVKTSGHHSKIRSITDAIYLTLKNRDVNFIINSPGQNLDMYTEFSKVGTVLLDDNAMISGYGTTIDKIICAGDGLLIEGPLKIKEIEFVNGPLDKLSEEFKSTKEPLEKLLQKFDINKGSGKIIIDNLDKYGPKIPEINQVINGSIRRGVKFC